MKKELNETETKRSAKRSGMARRITALVLAGVLTFGGTATVSAATLRDVFDAQYYSETYSDLKDAFGTNQTALYKLRHLVRARAEQAQHLSTYRNTEQHTRIWMRHSAITGMHM